MGGSGCREVCHIIECKRKKQQGFQCNTGKGIQLQLLLQGTVTAKGQSQRYRNPGQLANLPGHEENADSCQCDTKFFRRRKGLTENRYAEKDVYQRVDVIADTGIDDMIMIDGPDIGKPVQTDDNSGGHQHGAAFFILPQFKAILFQGLPALCSNYDDQHKHDRPEDAVAQNFISLCISH